IEAVVALSPDAILLSPFENAGHGVLAQTGIPIIECADYMESTPKGRAEWVKFLGLLYGCGAQADSIYRDVAAAYDTIVSRVAQCDAPRPVVLTEMLTDGYWFVPGGGSYMARLLQDAGAEYPWSNDRSTGSLQLDFSSVYARAADADFWLIRTYGHDLTLDDMRSVYLLNSQFKAFKEGNVYVANTAEVPLFEEFPFHPEKLLEEYARIFHPDVAGESLRYFHRVR
ncbi:MAG: ABC transporter substrate-binding protein, partial [Muribaculaceae bacterium]|nr:ABC transporter substrate-binding protein [Muribaculaceae bacterium]